MMDMGLQPYTAPIHQGPEGVFPARKNDAPAPHFPSCRRPSLVWPKVKDAMPRAPDLAGKHLATTICSKSLGVPTHDSPTGSHSQFHDANRLPRLQRGFLRELLGRPRNRP